MMQTCFIVVDKYGGSDVHGIAEYKTFFDPTFSQAFFDLGSDVDQSSPRRYLKPEFFTITFHVDPFLTNHFKELSRIFLRPQHHSRDKYHILLPNRQAFLFQGVPYFLAPRLPSR
jgi:hypothetical protein